MKDNGPNGQTQDSVLKLTLQSLYVVFYVKILTCQKRLVLANLKALLQRSSFSFKCFVLFIFKMERFVLFNEFFTTKNKVTIFYSENDFNTYTISKRQHIAWVST